MILAPHPKKNHCDFISWMERSFSRPANEVERRWLLPKAWESECRLSVCRHFFRAHGNSLKKSEKKNISEMIVFVEIFSILEVSGISTIVFRDSLFSIFSMAIWLEATRPWFNSSRYETLQLTVHFVSRVDFRRVQVCARVTYNHRNVAIIALWGQFHKTTRVRPPRWA